MQEDAVKGESQFKFFPLNPFQTKSRFKDLPIREKDPSIRQWQISTTGSQVKLVCAVSKEITP